MLLIYGDSGTGKSKFAEGIQANKFPEFYDAAKYAGLVISDSVEWCLINQCAIGGKSDPFIPESEILVWYNANPPDAIFAEASVCIKLAMFNYETFFATIAKNRDGKRGIIMEYTFDNAGSIIPIKVK